MKAVTFALIVATIVQAALSGPVPAPQSSEIPKTADEMVEFYVHNYYYAYDHRTAAINVQIEKLLPYIKEAKTKHAGDANKAEIYKNAELVLLQFQTKLNKFHNVAGITDILMLLAPGVAEQLLKTGDEELVGNCLPLFLLMKMDETEKRMNALNTLSAFLNASDESVKEEYEDKQSKWDSEHFSAVNFWD